MKTNYSDMKKRYELAQSILWKKLPKWKQVAIEIDRKNNSNTRLITEFANDIIKLAESNDKLIDHQNSIVSKNKNNKTKRKTVNKTKIK